MVLNRRIMANVSKVLLHSLPDIHFYHRYAQRLCQSAGIAMGAICGAIAGHDQRMDILGLFCSRYRHQQCQGRIQTAGQTHYRHRAYELHPLTQTGRLNLEYIFIFHRILGQEGMLNQGIILTIRTQRAATAMDGTHRLHLAIERSSVTDGFILTACSTDSADIGIGHQQIIIIDHLIILCQQITIFRNNAVTGEHQILGGLGATGGAVGIDTGANIGLMLHQAPSDRTLAHDLIGSGQVHHHFCTVDGQQGGRRQGCPQVFTNFNAQHTAVADLKQQVAAHRYDTLPCNAQILQCHLSGLQVLRRGEPATLGEFTVVRQVGLGHQTAEHTAGDDRGAVIHLAFHHSRSTHHSGNTGVLCRASHNGLQALHALVQQYILEKQVSAGIAGQRKLRKYHHIAAFFVCLGNIFTNIFRVFHRIAHRYRGHSSCNSDKFKHGKTS